MSAMKDWKFKLKMFLAVLAVVFAGQVTFGLNDNYDAGAAFNLRLFIGCLVAAAFTFFWGLVKNRG